MRKLKCLNCGHIHTWKEKKVINPNFELNYVCPVCDYEGYEYVEIKAVSKYR